MERLSNIKTVRMMVSEEKEHSSYKDKIKNIWIVCKKDALLRGGVAGAVCFFYFYVRIEVFSFK